MSLQPAKISAFTSNAFLIFLSRFFPSLANLGVILWFSHTLPRAVYGAYTHFWIHLNLLVPVACFGLHVVMITYSPSKLAALRASISRTAMCWFTAWGILCGAIFGFLQHGFAGICLLIPFLYFVAFAVTIVLESLLIVHRKFRVLVPVNVLYAVVFLLIHFQYGQTDSIPLPLFTFLLVALLAKLTVYILVLRNSDKQVVPDRLPETEVSEARLLWLHLGVYDITQNLFTWIDKFLVSLLLSTGLSAMYYNGTVNIPFLPLLINAAGSAILLQLPAGGEADDKKQLLNLLNHSGRLLSCLVFPLFAFLFFFRHEVVLYLFSSQYADAVPVFAMSILVLPLRAYSFTTVLQRHHKGRLINIGSLADLALSCLLMYPMYCWLGLPGLALSFVITTYLQAGYYLFASAKVLEVSVMSLLPLGNWLIKLIVFSGVFLLLHLWSAHQQMATGAGLIAGGGLLIVAIAVSLFADARQAGKLPA